MRSTGFDIGPKNKNSVAYRFKTAAMHMPLDYIVTNAINEVFGIRTYMDYANILADLIKVDECNIVSGDGKRGYCSTCGFTFDSDTVTKMRGGDYEYCPSCGAVIVDVVTDE